MKNHFWEICWIANILAISYMMVPFVLLDYNENMLSVFFTSVIGMIIFYPLALLGVLLWGYCLLNWSNVTKNSIHLVLLLFLTSLYTPIFYYLFFIKRRF